MKLLFTIKETASEIGFSRSYVDTEIREGRLIARKIGRNVRIERTELERWIRNHPTKIVGTGKGVPPLNTVREKTVLLQPIDNAGVADRGKR